MMTTITRKWRALPAVSSPSARQNLAALPTAKDIARAAVREILG